MGPRVPIAAGCKGKGHPGRGNTRTGGRRSCTFMVLFLLAITLLVVDVVQAVFTPEIGNVLMASYGHGPLKTAIDSCLTETGDGSCPNFAASNDTTAGNPYGVMGDWNVSKVTSMRHSTFTSVSRCLFIGCVTDIFLIFYFTPVFVVKNLHHFLPFTLIVSINFYVSGVG